MKFERNGTTEKSAAYLPNVATTLNNLAILYMLQGDGSQAYDMISEAMKIRRDLWHKQSTAFGNDLAQSLVIEGLILFQQHASDTETACRRWEEAYQVAISITLKQSIQKQISQQCSREESSKSTP